jgi:hypothetical protein
MYIFVIISIYHEKLHRYVFDNIYTQEYVEKKNDKYILYLYELLCKLNPKFRIILKNSFKKLNDKKRTQLEEFLYKKLLKINLVRYSDSVY